MKEDGLLKEEKAPPQQTSAAVFQSAQSLARKDLRSEIKEKLDKIQACSSAIYAEQFSYAQQINWRLMLAVLFPWAFVMCKIFTGIGPDDVTLKFNQAHSTLYPKQTCGELYPESINVLSQPLNASAWAQVLKIRQMLTWTLRNDAGCLKSFYQGLEKNNNFVRTLMLLGVLLIGLLILTSVEMHEVCKTGNILVNCLTLSHQSAKIAFQ